MNKNRIAKALSVLALLGGLFSCGGTPSSTTASSTAGSINSGSQNSDISSVSSSSAVKVTFWHTFNKTVSGYLDKKISEFTALVKKNDGVDLTIEESEIGDYNTILSTISKGLPVGNFPSMCVAYPDHIADYIASESTPGTYVVNLKDYADDSKVGFGKETWIGDGEASDFVPAFYDEGTHFTRSGMYTVPFMKSSEVMFYNKDMLSIAAPLYNAELNTTSKIDKFMKNISWDELMSFAQVIKTNASKIANTLKYPVFYDSDANLFISKAYQNNGGYLSIGSDGKGSIDFDSQSNKNMVTALKANFDAGLLTTKGIQNTYGSTSFTNMETAISIGSSGGADYQMPEAGAFTVGICKVPASNNNPLYVTQGPSLAILHNPTKSDAQNKNEALYSWKFIKYLTSANVDAYMCATASTGYIPVRNSAYQTEAYQTFLEEGEALASNANVVINDISGHYLVTPCFKGSSTARTDVGALLTQVFNNNKTVEDAFAWAVNDVKTHMA